MNYSIFESILKSNKIEFEKEYLFAKELKRKWRSDYMVTHYKGLNGPILAIEIEGGVHTNGRHTRGVGYVKDIEKYNAYTLLKIPFLRFTPSQIQKDYQCINTILSCLEKIVK